MAESMLEVAQKAREAAQILASLPGNFREEALLAMPGALGEVREKLFEANACDVSEAEAAGLSEPMLRRLRITDRVFEYMQDRLREVAVFPDPVGRILEEIDRPNGLKVSKISVPLGVIGIIFESRPNVTTDAASVCLRSGNAVILRGGSEALRTNVILADALREAAVSNGIPENAIQIIRTPDRRAVRELIRLDKYLDVIIPRGGKSLVEMIARESRVPVIKHYEGICHLYIAPDAAEKMAVELTVNSKCQRVEVCNALETLLIDQECAESILPAVVSALKGEGVECRGCEISREMMPELVPACEDDWSTEYLAPIISIKVVADQEAAMRHINTYGSGHTDAIVTASRQSAERFINAVDSASVLVNASTRLSGGGDYGLGAVVGISTDKLHARGPVGPNELTSYKWVALGKGHLRG